MDVKLNTKIGKSTRGEKGHEGEKPIKIVLKS